MRDLKCAGKKPRAAASFAGSELAIRSKWRAAPSGSTLPISVAYRCLADGRLRVQSGSMSVGQSHETVFAQIIADRFGIDADSVVYEQGNTEALPFGRGNGGSSATCVGGAAVGQATELLVDELLMRAAVAMDVPVGLVTLSEGLFRSRNRTLSLTELAELVEASADGVAAKSEATFKPQSGTFPNGTHICEVEVDPETGVVEIIAYSAVEDIGNVINPMTAHGQIHGGVAQGIGQVIGEEIIYDAEGQMLNGSFMDYRMPRADDMPFMRLGFHPVPTKVNPLGAKGVGEAGTVGALSAGMNAVNDALARLSVRHLDMPATPERVWRAIQEARSKAN